MHHSAEFEKISRLLHSTFYFSIIFSFAFTGILFVVAFLDVLDPIISNSLPLVGLTIPIFTAIAHLGNVCIGFGFPNYSFIPKYFIVPTATTIFVLIWLLYSAQLSTFAVMLSILLGYIAALHSQIIYLRICAPDSISQISFDYNIHFQYIRDSLPYFFVVLSRMVSNRFTLLALPFFVAVDQVGIFGFCITLISSILILTETSFSFFITRIVKFVSKNDNQNAAYELRKLRIFLIIFLIPIFSALVFVGPYIFGILFEETDLDWRILALLALGSIISALAGPLDRLCAAFKVVTPLLVFDIGSAIVTIAAAILLAGPFGLLGAAAAQVCGLAIKHLGRMWIIHYRVGLPL